MNLKGTWNTVNASTTKTQAPHISIPIDSVLLALITDIFTDMRDEKIFVDYSLQMTGSANDLSEIITTIQQRQEQYAPLTLSFSDKQWTIFSSFLYYAAYQAELTENGTLDTLRHIYGQLDTWEDKNFEGPPFP